MTPMKLAIASALFYLGLLACTPHANTMQADITVETMNRSMLTIITQSDPETQLMALILTKAAIDEGKTPRILLCSVAGDLALKQPPTDLTVPLAPKNISPHGLLKTMIENGIAVDVCAIYLPNRDFGKDALIEGVGIARPDAMAQYFIKDGVTLLSF